MTYAPYTITALARLWVSHSGVNLGIVGDASHAKKGVSYHLGKSALQPDAYSIFTARDKKGLTEAASAIDLGKLGGNLANLRAFSGWFVKRCQSNAPGTSDVREVIYTLNGDTVLRWDAERGIDSAPRAGEADNSHLWHTHISFYRDSEKRSKTALFAPYFAALPDTSTQEDEVIVVTIEKFPPRQFTSTVDNLRRFTATDELSPILGPYSGTVDATVDIESAGVPHGAGFYRLASGGSTGRFILASQVTLS